MYLVTDAELAQVSGWMLACADRVFPNLDELKKFLLERYGKEKQAASSGESEEPGRATEGPKPEGQPTDAVFVRRCWPPKSLPK